MGKGGMRWGAGRPGWHVKAEHCRHIDVRRLHRENLLRSGVATGWVWTDGETGERLASISVRVTDDDLTLNYSINDRPMQQRVPIERTSCTYGGTRPWFKCPTCWRRVAVLYVRASGFACRNCHRIVYASQSEDLCGRTWRRQAKLEARLGAHWGRPKGMHARTRERLLRGIFDSEERRDDALAVHLARFAHLL